MAIESRPWLAAGAVSLVLGTVVIFLISTGHWLVAGIWAEPSIIGWPTGFADLAGVTATAECLSGGQPLEPCDPYGRSFQPYVVAPGRLLDWLGLGVSATGWLGVLLACIYIIFVAYLAWTIARAWRSTSRQLVLTLIVLTVASITPPGLLAVERGQPEIIVLALSTLGLAVVGAGRTRARPFGALLLFISVTIKYFNVGMFAAYFAPRRWSWWAFVAMSASLIFLAFNWSDIEIARQTAGADSLSTSRVMFGAQTGVLTVVVADPAAFVAPAGTSIPTFSWLIGVGAVAILTAAWWCWFRAAATSPPEGISWFWIVGGTSTLTVTYVLGSSNDYRLIFLLPVIAGAACWWGSGAPRAQVWTLIGACVFTLATNAWMLPNSLSWEPPEMVILMGEFTLAAVLASGIALVILAWTRRNEHLSA